MRWKDGKQYVSLKCFTLHNLDSFSEQENSLINFVRCPICGQENLALINYDKPNQEPIDLIACGHMQLDVIKHEDSGKILHLSFIIPKELMLQKTKAKTK